MSYNASLLADESADYIQVNPILFPELHTLEFWIGEWEDVEPMIDHYFPLIESAPNLSTIRVEVNETTKDLDILLLRDSPGWKEVDNHLCRLAERANGPVILALEVSSLELPKDVAVFLEGPKFLPKFQKAGGLIRFE